MCDVAFVLPPSRLYESEKRWRDTEKGRVMVHSVSSFCFAEEEAVYVSVAFALISGVNEKGENT